LDELRRTNQYKVQLAHEEHRLLSKTLRERLIQTVTLKKTRLLRDKEQLDIADSTALLLNPNQFSTANPASPGGPQNPRKTRHTRLRPGEAGDEVGLTAVQENPKRKRKLAVEENDHESPAPMARNGDHRVSTPFRDARAKLVHAQYEAPVYSIERLFTEKELAMNLSRAHMVTSEFFARTGAHETTNSASVNGTTTSSVDLNGTDIITALQVAPDGKQAPADSDGQAAGAPTSVPTNIQTTNNASASVQGQAQTYHATRSTQRTGPSANPLDSLASAATALGHFAQPNPVLSVVAATSGNSKNGPPHAPPVSSLSEQEIQNDLALMQLNPEDPVNNCATLANDLSLADAK